MPGFLTGIVSKIAGDKAADIVTSVGEVADKFITTKQEKEEFNAEVQKEINRHIETLTSEQNKEVELFLKDMDSARNRELQIATSEKAPKFNKLITPLLASFISVGFFTLLLIATFHGFPVENAAVLNIMLGALGAGFGMVLSYYFGSSISSSKKQETIDKMMNSK